MKKHKTYQNPEGVRRGGPYGAGKSLASSLPSFRPASPKLQRGEPDLRQHPEGALTHGRLFKSRKVTLIDALDRVIDKGAYVDGEVVLRVADVDLVFIGLRLIITSVSNAERLRAEGPEGVPSGPYGVKRMGRQPNPPYQSPEGERAPYGAGKHGTGQATPEDLAQIQKLEQQLKDLETNIPKIIEASDPEKAEQGIAKLVLTLIELIRQLLEREAVRRVDTGALSETEIQKLGLTFKALEKKIQELKSVFGIKEELNLELGPLGNLL